MTKGVFVLAFTSTVVGLVGCFLWWHSHSQEETLTSERAGWFGVGLIGGVVWLALLVTIDAVIQA